MLENIHTFNEIQWQFKQPAWFLLLPMLSAAYWLLIKYLKPIKNEGTASNKLIHPLVFLMSERVKKQQAYKHDMPTWMRILILSLFVTPLAQPQRIGQQFPEPSKQRDILFIVDTSVGMQLRDYVLDEQRIDRLTLLKAVLSQFVNELKGSRMAVMVYAEDAHLLTPFTLDHELIISMISRIETTLAGRTNDIGKALSTAWQYATSLDQQRKPTLLLLSQGANLTGEIKPLDAARVLQSEGLTLHTIGLGAETELADESQRYGLHYDPINRNLLSGLAKITGGSFHWAGNSDDLQVILEKIKQSTQYDIDTEPEFIRHELYLWPLLLGLMIMTLFQLWQSFGKRAA